GAAVLGRHVQPGQATLAELGDLVVADPARLLDRTLVVALAELARLLDQLADALLLLLVGLRVGEDELLVDLPEEERLRERGDAVLRRRVLGGGRGFHPVAAEPIALQLLGRPRAGAHVSGGGADQAALPLLLEDVRRPA